MKTIHTVEAMRLVAPKTVSKKKGVLRWIFAAMLLMVQSQGAFGQMSIANGGDYVLQALNSQGTTYQLIGLYPGWDANAAYLGGYNATNNGNLSQVNKVVVGGAGSSLPLIVTGNISGRNLTVNNGGVSTLNVYGFWGGTPTEPVAKIVAADAGVGESGVAFNRKVGALDFELLNVHYQGTSRLLVHSNGNVLIGKTRPSNWVYLLDVNGSVRANEVVVNTTGADFVFDEGYKLMPLSEVESFIKANNHLPEMASAKEMQEEGAGVGEMQTKLLQKVEELTLHLIEMRKEVDAIKKENQMLKDASSKLQK